MIWSTISARASRAILEADGAKILQTLLGRRCRNNSRKMTSSSPPHQSCRMRRRNWEGLLSPSSRSLRRRCNFCWLDPANLLIRAALSWEYGVLPGGANIKSRTSVAASGEREVTRWSSLVFSTVMPRVANWASTWANHMSGSFGSNLREMALMAAASASCGLTSSGSPLWSRYIARWREIQTDHI